MRFGSIKENQFPRHFSFKIGEPGIRLSVIYMDYSFLKFDQVYIFVW